MTFSKRLIMLRQEKNMSRKELADALNISYSSISKYETDLRFPDQNLLKEIADFFDVSIDYLVGRTSIRNYHDKCQSSCNEKISESIEGNYYNDPDLSDEAIKQINDYIQFIKKKSKEK